jgi:hypothetical protein
MVIDLNKKKIKVKLKYIIPKEEQYKFVNFDQVYSDIEIEISHKSLLEQSGMTADEYLEKEPIIQNRIITENNEIFTNEINFGKKKTVYKTHFQIVFESTKPATFSR